MTTTLDNPTIARGILSESSDDLIVLSIPGTDYQLHLAVYQRPHSPVGKRILGTIRAHARRIDVVKTGGRYIEPVMGTPRRVQGQVIAIDGANQSICVHAGVPVLCKTEARQRPDQFKVGDFVSFDVQPGASFTPTSAG
ncbi:MAG TPA: hypothetical protein DEB06_06610 [Phycisphaerales bacterium]|nr:hypothetical protein [Phycisphaerales bacterium]